MLLSDAARVTIKVAQSEAKTVAAANAVAQGRLVTMVGRVRFVLRAIKSDGHDWTLTYVKES